MSNLEFWQKAFLAVLQGFAGRDGVSGEVVIKSATWAADEAVKVYTKRKEEDR